MGFWATVVAGKEWVAPRVAWLTAFRGGGVDGNARNLYVDMLKRQR